MIITNLLPALSGITQPITRPGKNGAAGDVTDENAGSAGKVRFIIEAPVSQPQTYEQPVNIGGDAAEAAGSFSVLLSEQQAMTAANNNGDTNISPFRNAATAYAAAETVGQYARSQGFYLGAL